MRLDAPARDLPARIGERLDAFLADRSSAPLALGYSGGGDSHALLLAADAWARRHGRELVVMNVDHGLQTASADWARTCAEVAARLGRPFVALRWTGPKPAQGVPAAARRARHALMAEAARKAGARVLLLGHTADDVAEAAAMRQAGSTTPAPRVWAPSPVWPEGRGVFLLRPMLGLSRAEIRDWLSARSEAWIDDPANDDLRYARPRARRALTGVAPQFDIQEPSDDPAIPILAAEMRWTAWGGLILDRARLRASRPGEARAVLAAACLCAAGTSRPPRGDRLERLEAQLRGVEDVVATLAGARIVSGADEIAFIRETGEMARTGLAPQALAPGRPTPWDGRFELVAAHPGLVVRPLAGVASRLDAPQRAALAQVPASARGGLPVILGDESGPVCPLLTPWTGGTVRALAGDRFAAACGRIRREPAEA